MNSSSKSKAVHENAEDFAEVEEGANLTDVAAKIHMNTDVRRRIFKTMMSSEDYLDAFEKLMKLKVPGEQEREYVRVLIACCLEEKFYNPFYAALGNKLCEYTHSHRITFQYSFWDKLKIVEELNVKQCSHLARLFAHLVTQGALSLMVLKVCQQGLIYLFACLCCFIARCSHFWHRSLILRRSTHARRFCCSCL